jgi:hypothetical protein
MQIPRHNLAREIDSSPMAQTDTNPPNIRIPHLQVIEKMVSGRLVGTRTPDLHRVNSCTDDAQTRKTEQ